MRCELFETRVNQRRLKRGLTVDAQECSSGRLWRNLVGGSVEKRLKVVAAHEHCGEKAKK